MSVWGSPSLSVWNCSPRMHSCAVPVHTCLFRDLSAMLLLTHPMVTCRPMLAKLAYALRLHRQKRRFEGRVMVRFIDCLL